MVRTPLRDGWRVLQRAPTVVLAEIAWRWTFGIALWAVVYYSFREYFASVQINSTEYTLLRYLEPYTWIAITARVMAAFLSGFRTMGPIIVPVLVILWVTLATVGRAATVRSLVMLEPKTNWVSSMVFSVFRVTFAFAAFLAIFGSGVLVNVIVGDTTQHFGESVALMLLFMLLIGFIWSAVNWLFSVAPIFAAAQGRGVWPSLADTGQLYRSESRSFVGTAFWFSSARAILIVSSTVASLWVFNAASRRTAVTLMVLISLAYFAVADALNMWRLATYISLTEPEASVTAPSVLIEPIAPPPGPVSGDPPVPSPEEHARKEASAEFETPNA
jgi:hypothetical protein